MRIDAPIFVPPGTPSSTHSRLDGPHWLAVETICSAHEAYLGAAYRGDRPTRAAHAASVLDTLDAKLESLIGRIALNPDSYQILHDGAPIPAETLQAFHQAIIRRDWLAPSMQLDREALAPLLRPLTGISPRWVSDHKLAQMFPQDLLTRLQRALVFSIFPGDLPPEGQNRATIHPPLDSITQAIGRMGPHWQNWAKTVAQRTLPRELPTFDFPVERVIARNTLKELAATPPSVRGELTNAGLDYLDLNCEESLHFAIKSTPMAQWAATINDNDQISWNALKGVLTARTAAQPDLIDISRALVAVRTMHGATPDPRAALLLPLTQRHALARSAAGHASATGVPPDQAMVRIIDNMGHRHPAAWRALCWQVDDIGRCLTALNTQYPMLDALLHRMWDAYPAAREDHAPTAGAGLFKAAREALASYPHEDTASKITTDEIADQLDRAIALFRDDHRERLSGTELPVWLAALSQQAQRNHAGMQALMGHLADIGLGTDPLFARAFVEAARCPADQRTHHARRLFEQYKSLPQDTQYDIVRKAGLDASRLNPPTRALLATWRSSEVPELPALADLFDRVSSRIREYVQKQASHQASEGENRLLEEAIERAKQERTQSSRTELENKNARELDGFLQTLPTRGTVATRRRAVRAALQELTPLSFCVLLIETSNTLLAQMAKPKIRKLTDSVAKYPFTTLTYIINEAAALVRNQKNQPNLGELRGIIRSLLDLLPGSSLIEGVNDTRLADRMMLCLDNFTSWVHTVCSATDEPSRIRILEEFIGGAKPLSPQTANQVWQAQIRDAIRINGMDNYFDLRMELSQIPAIGPQLLNIWNTTLDVYAARMSDSLHFSELAGDWQSAVNLANASISQLQDRLGGGFLLLAHLPDFRTKLDSFLAFSGSIAGGHGRANNGAMLAYHIVYVLRALADNPFSTLS